MTIPFLISCLAVLCRPGKKAKGSESFQGTGTLPYIALTLTAFLFGLSFVATKYALTYISPFSLIFLRFLIAFILLEIFHQLTSPRKIDPGDRWQMALAALILPGGYFLAETLGLKFSTASSISLLIATIPIFTALFAFIFLQEEIRLPQALAIGLSILGVGILLGAHPEEIAREPIMRIGNLFGLGAAVCAGTYMVFARNLMKRYAPLTLTRFQALFALLIFLPLAGWEQATHPRISLPLGVIGAIIYLAVFCSVLAFFLWNYGISRLEASTAAVFTNLVPVFTVMGAILLLGERFHPRQIFGGALIITGVTLASKGRKKR